MQRGDRDRWIRPAARPPGTDLVVSTTRPIWRGRRATIPTARRNWESALGIVTRRFGPTHARAATMLNNLALLANHFGDPDAAIGLEQRALAIWTSGSRSHAPECRRAHCRNSRRCTLHSGDYRQARAMLERRAPYSRTTPRGEPRWHCRHAPGFGRARDRPRGVAPCRRARVGRGARVRGARRTRHTWIDHRSGHSERSWRGTGERLTTPRRASGASRSPSPAPTAMRTRRLRRPEPGRPRSRWHAGQLRTRRTARGRRGDDGSRPSSTGDARFLSERLALSYEATRPPALDVLVSAALASSETELAASAFTEARPVARPGVRRARGATASSLVTSRRPGLGCEKRFQTRCSRWANSRFAVRTATHDTEPRQCAGRRARRRRSGLSARWRRKARSFARTRGPQGGDRRRYPAAVPTARRSCRSSVMAGAFRCLRVRLARRPSRRRRRAPSYVAIVTSRTTPPVLVDLGDAASLERLVATPRNEAARGVTKSGRTPRQAERAYRQAGAALRARIWDPLTAHVTGATRDPRGAGRRAAGRRLRAAARRHGSLSGRQRAGVPLLDDGARRHASGRHRTRRALAAGGAGGADFGGSSLPSV